MAEAKNLPVLLLCKDEKKPSKLLWGNPSFCRASYSDQDHLHRLLSDYFCNRLRVFVLGPPGSGKGTQGQMLSKLLRIPVISTGGRSLSLCL
jgi:hypothetical protein